MTGGGRPTGDPGEDDAAPVPPPAPPVFGPPPPPAFIGPGSRHGPAAPSAVSPEPPPPTAAMLAIPLGPRRLVGTALDLLTRPDAGLRGASFYIGLVLLVTVAPGVALFGLVITGGDVDPGGAIQRTGAIPDWMPCLMLALLPALVGFVVAGVEANALAVAVIGGRAEGRPLRLRESVAAARARFWSVLGARLVVGVLTGGTQVVLAFLIAITIGSVGALGYVLSVIAGVVAGTPFIYATAGIVLGGADAVESLRRSLRLARARAQLAVVVTLFSVLSGLVVQLGLGVAADTVMRVLAGAGLVDRFPPPLVVPLAAALVFAYGTLLLLAEAIAAAPAVHAFVALTHATGGLERGRREPVPTGRLRPWFTPGLAAGGVVGLTALVGGVVAIRWH